MKLLSTTAIILTTAFAAPAMASKDVSLYDVEVKADFTDFANSNALTYWPDLEADLQRAIAERVTLSGQDEDPRVEVLISKVSVDGDTVLPDSGEFNQLEGIVFIYDGEEAVSSQGKAAEGEDAPIASYPLRLSAKAPDNEAPEGWVMIPPSKDDFYTAMVEAFAAEVVDDIEQ